MAGTDGGLTQGSTSYRASLVLKKGVDRRFHGGALAVTPHRRYAATAKQLLLDAVRRAQTAGDVSVRDALQHLGIGHTTYYRWTAREEAGRLVDDPTRRARFSIPPTPAERAAVREFARAHPLMGYKRLTWDMIDRDIAYLRPSQVYQVLQSANLLARRPPLALDPLRRPLPPDRPDQVWHVDCPACLKVRQTGPEFL